MSKNDASPFVFIYLKITLLVSLLSIVCYADDDTELYASHQLIVNPDIGSNILIILDKSGSMRYNLPGTPSPLSGGSSRIAHLSDALLLLLDELQGVNLGFASFSGSTHISPPRSNVPIIFPIGSSLNTVPTEVSSQNTQEILDLRINRPEDDAVQNLSDSSMLLSSPSIFMTHTSRLAIPTGDTTNHKAAVINTHYQLNSEREDSFEYLLNHDQKPDKRVWFGRSSNDSQGLIHAGFRFKNLGIPQGSIIHSAKITLTSDDNQNDDIRLHIKVVDQDNPALFNNIDGYIDALPTFSASQTWHINAQWHNKQQYNSPDFAAVLQHLINQDYWNSEDALVVIMSGDDSLKRGDNQVLRQIGSNNSLTQLSVSYSEPNPNSTFDPSTKTTVAEISNADNHSKEYLSPESLRGDMGSRDALWLANQYNNREQSRTLLGFRFENIQIPHNATIKAAYLKINLDNESSSHTDEPLEIIINGEDNLFAEPYNHGSNNDYDLSRRRLKTTQIIWQVQNGTEQETISSPDLSALIREYVNHTAWRSDSNAISLLLKANSAQASGRRGVCGVLNSCYSSQGNHAPQLVIEWEGGEAIPAHDYSVGLRFQTVNIPQGASISRAYLEFPSNAKQTNSVSYIISAAKAGDDGIFLDSNYNLSQRERLATQVNWDNVSVWEQGNHYQSAELAPLIQAIINQGDGWCAGRDMVFFINANDNSPNSLRQFSSYEGNADNSVKLHIEYDSSTIPNNACVTRTQSYQITQSNDDAEETIIKAGNPSNSVFLHNHPLDMTTDGINGEETVRLTAYRFGQLNIRAETPILRAELVFTASRNDTNTSNLLIYTEKGAAVAFSDVNADLSSRLASQTQISWQPSAWQRDKRYHVDVTELVRENLNASWQAGDSMAFFVTGTGLRRAYAFDNEPNNAALLKITFTGRYQDNLPTVRDRLKELVIEHTRSGSLGGWTPLVPALYEGAQYYLGGSLYGGDYRGVTPNSTYYYGDKDNVVSHRASFSRGLIYSPDNACTLSNRYSSACRDQVICSGENIAVDSHYTPHAACGHLQFEQPARYTQPPMSSCSTNHIILFTDGEATAQDPYVNTQIQNLSASACDSRNNSNENCGIELAQYLFSTDINPNLDGIQNVITHTIGFALNDVAGTNFLKQIATAGGGNFYEANNAESILTALQDIVRLLRHSNAAFAAPTLSINAFNRLFHNDEVYFTLFAPNDKTLWQGNSDYEVFYDATANLLQDGSESEKQTAILT